MVFIKLAKTFFFVVLFGLAFLIQNAYAYIDPGTGSWILQIFLAALVGGLLTIKIFFKKIKGSIGRFFGNNKATQENKNIKPK